MSAKSVNKIICSKPGNKEDFYFPKTYFNYCFLRESGFSFLEK